MVACSGVIIVSRRGDCLAEFCVLVVSRRDDSRRGDCRVGTCPMMPVSGICLCWAPDWAPFKSFPGFF